MPNEIEYSDTPKAKRLVKRRKSKMPVEEKKVTPKRRVRRKKVIAEVEETAKVTPSGAPIRPDSVRQRVLSMMQSGLNDEEIRGIINEESPESAFGRKQVVWYRSTFATAGQIKPHQASRGGKVFGEWFDSIDWDAFEEFCNY